MYDNTIHYNTIQQNIKQDDAITNNTIQDVAKQHTTTTSYKTRQDNHIRDKTMLIQDNTSQ